MGTAPAGDGGTGCTPRDRGCQSRRAGSAPWRRGLRSARTGAACYGSRTPGSPGRARLRGAAVRPAGQPGRPPRRGRRRGGRGLVRRRRRRSAARSRPPVAGRPPPVPYRGDRRRGAGCPLGTGWRAGGSANRRTGGSSRPHRPGGRRSGRARPARRRHPHRVFGAGPARGPQLPQGNIQLVHVRGRRDLAHPGEDSAAAAASLRIETPSARAEPAPRRAPARPDPGARPPAIAEPAVPAARPPSGP